MTILFSLLGGVALFLFGMQVMGDGLKKAAGSRLELVLYRLSGTVLRGIALGTGVTAVIQSSSATSVMAVGFVNSGMMKTRQAVSVIMGAIIGTSVTGWILCLGELGGGGSGWLSLLSTETLTSLVAVAGVILTMFSKKQSRRSVGSILMGFAVLMYGMQTMSGSVSSLRSSPVFLRLLTGFSRPLIGVLAGLLVTAVIQSASAAVGILQAMAVTGVITLPVAVPVIMGIAIGAAVPVLLTAIGASVEGKRSALSYLVINTVGTALFALLYYGPGRSIAAGLSAAPLSSVGIALLNTLFRAAIVLLEAPFIGALEKLLQLLIPSGEENTLADIDRLEERFLANPPLAVEQSRLTILSMAEKTRDGLLRALELMDAFSEEGYASVERTEAAMDRYEDKLGSYLVKITAKELDEGQYKAVGEYLRSLTDLERISDHSLNLAESAQEIHSKDIAFTAEGKRELSALLGAVSEIVTLSTEAFSSENRESAERIEPLEQVIDRLCDELKAHHINRVQKGECSLENGFVFNDILTDLERVADHCSNLGLAVLERSEDIEAHDYLHGMKESRTESFRKHCEEYAAKYAI